MDPKPLANNNAFQRFSNISIYNKSSTESISLTTDNRLSSNSNSSEENGSTASGKPEIVRRIAGKKISALFEV